MSQCNAVQRLQQQVANSPSGLLKPTMASLTEKATPLKPPSDETKSAEDTFPEIFPLKKVYINHKLPSEVAILYVFETGEGYYQTLGGNAELELEDMLQTEAQKGPRLALGKMVVDHEVPEMEKPKTIRDLMTEFSHHQLDIKKWIKKLIKQLGDDKLLLIIVDYTDFEIPWEMFEVFPGQYLGALITTARWQHIIGEDDHIHLEINPDECQGNILAYFNRAELPETQQEAASLQELHSTSYDDILEFRQHLERTKSGFGLVYMACHGMFDHDVRHLALGATTDPEQRLTLISLRRHALKLLQESQSVVFINACHSGRLHKDDYRVCAKDRIGFAELFLGKGSRAVIGTLGGISDKYAARIGQRLIEEVTQSPDIPLATILKNLRARVVSKLTNDSTDQDLLEFIYTFMYVYYGNPLLKLRLVSRETPNGGC